MTNFAEKGHAKNVANLGTLITFTTGFGTGYNPSKKSITLPALNTLREEAQKSLAVVNTHYVKKYVKSVFGATSPEFKQVSGLEFTRLKN